ncbi:MAG: sulfotransferase [Nitrosomonas sp.]|nr:MAG: sulfotransferase [Nitrosomonas sp.]
MPEALLKSIQEALDASNLVTAKQICEDHLQAMPNDPDTYRYLSQIHAILGEFDQARRAANRALEIAPQDPRAWSDLGRVEILSGNFSTGITCFEEAVKCDSGYADGWHNLGLALKQSGDQQRAFDALKKALLLNPERADSYVCLGNLLVDAGQLEDAIGCFERAVKYNPAMAAAHYRLAQELHQRGEVERAESIFRHSLTIDSGNVTGWIGLAQTLEDLGQAEAALGCYRNVLKRKAGHTLALNRYLSLVRDEEGLAWIEQMETALDRSENAEEAKALIGYGLAKFYDRHSRFAEAAHAGLRANAARRKAAGAFNREALCERVDAIIRTYNADFFAQRRDFGVETDQPVFIVGLPRSGTTLTEQILSAHPLLHGAGELPDLAKLAIQSLPEGDLPWQAALRLDAQTVDQLANEYLQALRRNTLSPLRRISDKQPLNFFHLAFVALLFPSTRIIHCTRNVRDNALSIWMENFNVDQEYATDFEDLAYFITQYKRLMAHWQAVLPLNILEMCYEKTVADLDGQARRLIKFLDVPWDEQCLDFHQIDRAVQTPSRWQVRQPIYTRSVNRWERYREYLPTLETAFVTE